MSLNNFICSKDSLKFEVEILKISDIENAYFLRIKKVQGTKDKFRQISKRFIEFLNA